jgi:hypothetical protein
VFAKPSVGSVAFARGGEFDGGGHGGLSNSARRLQRRKADADVEKGFRAAGSWGFPAANKRKKPKI